MKRNRLRKSAKKAVLTATMALAAAGVLQASVHSDVVTAGKYTQPAGATLVNYVAHPNPPVYAGKVTAVAGDVISIEGTLTAGALDAVDIAGSGRITAQYVVKLRHDRTGDGPKNQGDWFKVASNTASTVTVDPNGVAATSASVAVGDEVQIEKLPSLKDVFGSGASVLVDSPVAFDDQEADAIYFLNGAAFAEAWIYFAGSWYETGNVVDGGDGSQVTLTPDQAVFNFNRVGPAYDSVATGGIQCFALSHFIFPGFNGIATGFAAPTAISASGLFVPPIPGSTFASTAAFDDAGADAFYVLDGTSFLFPLVYFEGVPGWWDVSNVSQEDGYLLQPATGYFVKNEQVSSYIWREPKP